MIGEWEEVEAYLKGFLKARKDKNYGIWTIAPVNNQFGVKYEKLGEDEKEK